MLCRFYQLRKISVFTHFTHSAALLQAALHANTESFEKGSVKMKNRAVEMTNGLETLVVLVQILPKRITVSLQVFFNKKY